MKYSVWSSYYYELSPEDALRQLKAHGFSCCELSCEHAVSIMNRGDAIINGTDFAKFAAELGMEISQGHLSYDAKLCKPEGKIFLKKQLDLFRAIGIKNAVLHLDYLAWKDDNQLLREERIKENYHALAELLDHIKDTDMVICLENLISADFANNIDGLMYYIEGFNSKNLGICLDTGHLNLCDGDQVNFIRKGGKNIKALHLANNDGSSGDQHLMPFTCGYVDFITVIREMKALNYQGLYNLEIPGERYAPLEILGYKLDYIKKMLEYLDSITE